MYEGSFFSITRLCRVMPNSDPRNRFVHPHDPYLTLMSLVMRIIMKSLDPLRAKKIFIRKKLGHTAVSAIKASSVTL